MYIAGAGLTMPSRQNVAALSASVSAAVLAQFGSLVAHPGGEGVPAPLRYTLASHTLEQLAVTTASHCPFETHAVAGDDRVPIAEHRDHWREVVATRQRIHIPLRLRVLAQVETLLQRAIGRL